jgi:hypothetical protein
MNVFLQGITSNTGLSASARTLQYTSNVTAGSLLTAWIPTLNPAITVTVRDDINGAWAQAGGYAVNGNNRGSWWYFKNSAGGSKPTVTVTPSAISYVAICLHEHSVTTPTAVSLDSTVTNSGSSISATTGTCTVSGIGELVLAGFASSSAFSAITVAAPFIAENVILGGPGEDGATAGDVAASTSEGATFTLTPTAPWAAMAVSFNTGAVYFCVPLTNIGQSGVTYF